MSYLNYIESLFLVSEQGKIDNTKIVFDDVTRKLKLNLALAFHIVLLGNFKGSQKQTLIVNLLEKSKFLLTNPQESF